MHELLCETGLKNNMRFFKLRNRSKSTTKTSGVGASSVTRTPTPPVQQSTESMINSEALKKGNRDQIADYYVAKNLTAENADFSYKILTRLNASKKTSFHKVSFVHAVFEGCYFNQCFFDSCDFTGARFIGCNFHQTSFSGCKFAYATAISFELQATESYLYKSWASGETYYREKYRGIVVVRQFWRWICFRVLDFVWGNGESILKLLRSFVLAFVVIGLSEGITSGEPWNLRGYLAGLQHAPAIFFGVAEVGSFGPTASSIIAATRLVGMAFLTAILIKRLGRR